jgi:PEP-CTERM motif
MRRITFFGLLALCMALMAPHASATANCSTLSGDTIAQINAAGGCDLAGLFYLSSFAIQGASGTPTATFSAAGTVGFQINWNPALGVNGTGNNQDIQFEYSVVAINGASLTAVSLESNGSAGSSILENVCTAQGSVGGGCGGVLLATMSVAGFGSVTAPISPAQTATVWAWKDITLDPGASISGFGQDFETPEPGTLVLFGSGMLGLAGLLRRKLKA